MADKKTSELTELTSADAATDLLPVVDTSADETKKIRFSNLPLSDSAKNSVYPYTTDFHRHCGANTKYYCFVDL